MNRITCSSIAILLLCSCKEVHTTRDYRDSVMLRYFAMADSSGVFDTTDLHYRSMKAYFYDDTSKLKELDSLIGARTEHRSNWELWKKDIPLVPLEKLNSNGSYRFIYSLYGGANYESITVQNSGGSYSFHYGRWRRGDSVVTHEVNKMISKSNWEEMERHMENFWDLKPGISRRGDDGSDITVIGCRKNDHHEIRTNHVHRWGSTSDLHLAFYYLYWTLLTDEERVFQSNNKNQNKKKGY